MSDRFVPDPDWTAAAGSDESATMDWADATPLSAVRAPQPAATEPVYSPEQQPVPLLHVEDHQYPVATDEFTVPEWQAAAPSPFAEPAPMPGYVPVQAPAQPPHAPQYAQPQYAEPGYADPAYAQPQYAQPQYAQPQHTQPAPVFAQDAALDPYAQQYAAAQAAAPLVDPAPASDTAGAAKTSKFGLRKRGKQAAVDPTQPMYADAPIQATGSGPARAAAAVAPFQEPVAPGRAGTDLTKPKKARPNPLALLGRSARSLIKLLVGVTALGAATWVMLGATLVPIVHVDSTWVVAARQRYPDGGIPNGKLVLAGNRAEPTDLIGKAEQSITGLPGAMVLEIIGRQGDQIGPAAQHGVTLNGKVVPTLTYQGLAPQLLDKKYLAVCVAGGCKPGDALVLPSSFVSGIVVKQRGPQFTAPIDASALTKR